MMLFLGDDFEKNIALIVVMLTYFRRTFVDSCDI
jgi:hypothetical protein